MSKEIQSSTTKNMKEIKFRAWDGKRMFFPCDKRFDTSIYFSEYGWEIVSHFTGELKVIARSLNNAKATLMQFTGLKDKKGKEIYEGDIIMDGENIRQVKYSSQNAAYYLSTTDSKRHFYKEFIECGQSQSDGAVHCDTIEVIGNIYENPELIQQPIKP